MNGKYKVFVDDKEFQISVKEVSNIDSNISSEQNNEINKDPGGSASKDVEMNVLFEAVKSEYEHSISRSEKLDNKVYIVLTVCGFLFVMLSDIIKSISTITFPTECYELMLIIIFSVLLFSCVCAFTLLLINLASLLKPILLERLKSKRILNDDLVTYPPETSFRTICILYEQSIESNDAVLEDRFRKFRFCVNIMIFVIGDLIVIAVLRQFM